MLKDRIFLLDSPDAVDAFMGEYPTSVIFKAGTCHKTMQGFGFLQEELEPREDLVCGVIRVIEARPASNHVADVSGVVHESPQVILFKEGQPVFDADNWDITKEALSLGFDLLPVGEAVAPASRPEGTELSPYFEILESFLGGEMDTNTFVRGYIRMFRTDANLRPNDEVEALNSIFGDVDQHMNMHMMMAGESDGAVLRQRAESAYQRLKEIVASRSAATA